MVVPWFGIPLASIIDRLEPTTKAKYVEFTTLLDPQQMPGQRDGSWSGPMSKALRLDEARHPLALIGHRVLREAAAQSEWRAAPR